MKALSFSLLLYLIMASARAHEFSRCGVYSAQGFVRLDQKHKYHLVINPTSRSEYIITFQDGARELLEEYVNLPIQLQLEISGKDQKFQVSSKCLSVDFVLPNEKQSSAKIQLIKEKVCEAN